MTQESWDAHPDYPLYLVSSHGKVFNRRYERPVRPYLKRSGHVEVELVNDFGPRAFYLHRLVAHVHIRPIDGAFHVKHKDGDFQNNHVSNLKIILNPRLYKEPRYCPPHRAGRPVMINETGEVFTNAYECAEELGGTASAIYGCLRGERNHHLGFTFRYI